MESLISSYGIDFTEFRRIMSNPDFLLAGSFALNGYLKQEGIYSGYEPGDIDIFHTTYDYSPKPHTFNSLLTLLANSGFKDSGKFEKVKSYYDCGTITIYRVTSYVNSSGKEIQLISVFANDLVKYIHREFDLSICVSWWDSIENTFKTMNPTQTKRKEMCMVGDKDIYDEKYARRIEKYKSRGFTFVEPPCVAKVTPDNQEGLNDIDDEAFDIFNFEDVSIKDYLQQSTWHMILKTGEKFYAFHRKALVKCIIQKRVNYPMGDLYETPFHQAIAGNGLDIFTTSDYSIFELIWSHNVTTKKNGIKSVYTIKPYTLKQWVDTTSSSI